MQQCSVHVCSKRFGKCGMEGLRKEARQLQDQTCFGPYNVKTLKKEEKERVQEALACSTEKRNSEIEG